MCVDGYVAVTSSLDGEVRVWDLDPMKRRCVRLISRRYTKNWREEGKGGVYDDSVCVCICSNLWHGPPPEVPSSSQRPAAEGCEASHTLTSGTATPTGKYQGVLQG